MVKYSLVRRDLFFLDVLVAHSLTDDTLLFPLLLLKNYLLGQNGFALKSGTLRRIKGII